MLSSTLLYLCGAANYVQLYSAQPISAVFAPGLLHITG